MGSAASSSQPSTPSPTQNLSKVKKVDEVLLPNESSTKIGLKTLNLPKNTSNEKLVPLPKRTHEVAPIVIRNCREEFQRLNEFHEVIVMGQAAEYLSEHPLIKSQYFMVRDVSLEDDRLFTLRKYLSPNCRKSNGRFDVWGMGQPTKNGLTNLLNQLHSVEREVILINFREDPVLFVNKKDDMIPYTARHQDRLHSRLSNTACKAAEIDIMETEIRREIIEHASMRNDRCFYFYDDIITFENEPHLQSAEFDDQIAVSEEIYSRLSVSHMFVHYKRVVCPANRFPFNSEMDNFINTLKNVESLTIRKTEIETPSSMPAFVFTCQTGLEASTVGMVMGYLVLNHCFKNVKQFSHHIGCNASKENDTNTPNSDNPVSCQCQKSSTLQRTETRNSLSVTAIMLESGHFHVINQLIHYIPNGKVIKVEVDQAIDACDKLINLRKCIYQAKKHLEAIQLDFLIDGVSAKKFYHQQCIYYLERYFMLIVYNAYLHDQLTSNFRISWSSWLLSQPRINRLLQELDISEYFAPTKLLPKRMRFLVADDYVGLDMLSSQWEVSVSNFRRVLGWPIYGMAQPTRVGLAKVLRVLRKDNVGHSSVLWINLRDDLHVEVDGRMFSWRERERLGQAILLRNISKEKIEELELDLKNEVQNTSNNLSVYFEIDEDAQSIHVTNDNVLTSNNLAVEVGIHTSEFTYYRLPLQNDLAPPESFFDTMVQIYCTHETHFINEQGPALLFSCRTGKGRTTTAMAVACLLHCHVFGFAYGAKLGEQERVSLRNAQYTKGEYKVIQELVRLIPNGQQVKRELDYVLDQCFDTMTPMHYHIREEIFVAYNKSKKCPNQEEQAHLKLLSLQYLERYFYLILFNAYLHAERHNFWSSSFSKWLSRVNKRVALLHILDRLSFLEFENTSLAVHQIRNRWIPTASSLLRGSFN